MNIPQPGKLLVIERKYAALLQSPYAWARCTLIDRGTFAVNIVEPSSDKNGEPTTGEALAATNISRWRYASDLECEYFKKNPTAARTSYHRSGSTNTRHQFVFAKELAKLTTEQIYTADVYVKGSNLPCKLAYCPASKDWWNAVTGDYWGSGFNEIGSPCGLQYKFDKLVRATFKLQKAEKEKAEKAVIASPVRKPVWDAVLQSFFAYEQSAELRKKCSEHEKGEAAALYDLHPLKFTLLDRQAFYEFYEFLRYIRKAGTEACVVTVKASVMFHAIDTDEEINLRKGLIEQMLNS